MKKSKFYVAVLLSFLLPIVQGVMVEAISRHLFGHENDAPGSERQQPSSIYFASR